MMSSRKRTRIGDAPGDGKQLENSPKQLSSLDPEPVSRVIKSHRWRSRKRTQTVSGTQPNPLNGRSQNLFPERTLSINGFYGGKFSSKSIFSKDEKYPLQVSY